MGNDSTYKVGVILEVQGGSRADAELAKVDNRLDKFGTKAANVAGSEGLGKFAQAASVVTGVGTAINLAGQTLGQFTSVVQSTAGAVFELVKSSSDFGSQIWDAKQKTGLSTDTLQALNFAASQGGASFDEISGSVNKFAKVLGNAKEGNKEAQKTLDMLGVSSFDMETALSQAYSTILKYPEGTDQMKASMEAFGKSGAELLPFIKEFDGDLDGLKKRAADLGLILDEETIKSADKFGDTLDMIGLQAKASVARFALEFAPAITQGMNSISQFLIDNQATFAQWGTGVNDELTRVLTEIQNRGGDWKAAGAVLGEELAEGVGAGFGAAIGYLGNYIGKRLHDIFTGQEFIDPITKSIGGSILQGLGEGLGILDREVVMPPWKDAAAQVQTTNAEVSTLKSNVKGIPSLADKLKLDKAEDEAKKANEQYKRLSDTVKSLALQAQFFGDESQVAATKQNLLNLGITNFDNGLAKSALGFAEYLDKLKAAQKAQTEYAQGLKSAKDYISSVNDDIDLKLYSKNANELEKFNLWVRKSASNFRELKGEIEFTGQRLRNLLVADASAQRSSALKAFRTGIKDLEDEVNGVSTSDFEALSKKFLSSFDITESQMDEVIKGVGIRIHDFYVSYSKARNDEERDAVASMVNTGAQNWLSLYKDKVGLQIFANDAGMFDWFVRLHNALSDKQLLDGGKKLDDYLKSLGVTVKTLDGRVVGATTPLEELNKFLSDPAMTAAIEARAKAFGMTADELKRLMQAAATPNRTFAQARGDKEYAGHIKRDDGIKDWLGIDKIQTQTDIYKGLMSDLKTTTKETFGEMTGAIGQSIAAWLIYGDSVGASLSKATKELLANLAAQAITKAVWETAEGFAMLALAFFGHPQAGQSATAHFAAAAVYAGIGGLAAGGARALNGGGSSSQSSSPDYYTSNPSSSSGNYSNIRTTDPTTRALESRIAELSAEVKGLSGSFTGMSDKLRGMKPEDVLAVAANRKPQTFVEATTRGLKTNSTAKKELQTTLNLK